MRIRKFSKRQITVEVLSRLILYAEKQIEVLKGCDNQLCAEMSKIKKQIEKRRMKLIDK